jgi:flagellar biosynthetic protein FliP
MKKILSASLFIILILILLSPVSQAQAVPKLSVELGETDDPGALSTTLQVILLLTVLTLAPSIILMVTSFVRIVVVLGFLRQAMGTQQLPPNQLLISLALILTFFIISPAAN